jgi:hypothetical protein
MERAISMTRSYLSVQVGDVCGFLTVVEIDVRLSPRPGRKIGPRGARCRCKCGGEKVVTLSYLSNGGSRSCKCQGAERVPYERVPSVAKEPAPEPEPVRRPNRAVLLVDHPLYALHRQMMSRCYDPTHPDYPQYGARGIKVQTDWHHVRTFILDIERMHGTCPPGSRLARVLDSDYSPHNVEWRTREGANV